MRAKSKGTAGMRDGVLYIEFPSTRENCLHCLETSALDYKVPPTDSIV